jgi:hypothetical protein
MPDAMSLSVFLRHSTRKLWYARRESTHIDREGEVVAMEAPDALQALCYPSGGGGLAHRMQTGGDPRTRIDREYAPALKQQQQRDRHEEDDAGQPLVARNKVE